MLALFRLGQIVQAQDNYEIQVYIALQQTIEITRGLNSFFEVGGCIFTSARAAKGWQWPVGMSLSAEFGYQQPAFSTDTWTLELRPIVDRQLGQWYLSFNPTAELALTRPDQPSGWEFSPDLKVGFDFTQTVNAGFEYYGSVGPFNGFDAPRDQHYDCTSEIRNFMLEWH